MVTSQDTFGLRVIAWMFVVRSLYDVAQDLTIFLLHLRSRGVDAACCNADVSSGVAYIFHFDDVAYGVVISWHFIDMTGW